MPRKGREGKGDVPPKLISQFKLEDCTLRKDSQEYKVYETAKFLYDRFSEKFPHNKDLPLRLLIDWIPPVRSLMKDKEYTHSQIVEVARWAVNDKFWKKTILDTESLEKHFERLKIEYQDGKSKAA